MVDKEQQSPVAGHELSRREFVVTTLAAGFALAVQPVAAETIATNADGLIAGEVKIAVRGGDMPAYRAMPAKAGAYPVVVVVHEIFGVHEYIKDVCRRLGKLGYLAIAPALYARQGDVSSLANVQDIITTVVAKVPDAQVMSDLDATVAWARKKGNGGSDKLAITGFCWGGRVVWLYAAHSSHLDAGVAWYGRVVGPTDDLHPKNPVDVAASLHAPVLGLYGGADAGIPPESIEQMRQALKAAKRASEIVVYPDAPHGFHADYRDSYRSAAAADGWTRMLAWFKQHGLATHPGTKSK